MASPCVDATVPKHGLGHISKFADGNGQNPIISEGDNLGQGGDRLVFVGIDHGTTAIRVAIMDTSRPEDAQTFEIMKSEGKLDFMEFLKDKVELGDIEMVAVAYSMGDAISSIRPVERLEDRGVTSLEDIGPMTGIGTRMFDEVRASGLPAVALPGLHRDCPWLEPRFTIFQSHVASPKKVAAAFFCYNELARSMDVSDLVVTSISSNTVSILIKDHKVVGGIDACLGAPGLRHGPLDVESLRSVDQGHITANEAFSTRGLIGSFGTPERLLSAYGSGDERARQRLDALIMYVAMEVSGLVTIGGRVDAVAVTGSLGEVKEPVDISREIGRHLGREVFSFTRFSAAIGAAQMAALVKDGKRKVFGIPVDV